MLWREARSRLVVPFGKVIKQHPGYDPQTSFEGVEILVTRFFQRAKQVFKLVV